MSRVTQTVHYAPCQDLICDCVGDPFYRGQGLSEFKGDGVTFLEKTWRVIGDPGLITWILRHQQLERQIQCNGRRCEHQWGSRFGASEDDHFRWGHLKSRGRSLSAVIDDAEDFQSLAGDQSLNPLHRLGKRMQAANVNDSAFL